MSNSNLRLIVEKNIPFVKGLLDRYASVSYLAPEDITADAVREADGLMTRTRTFCNEALLKDSNIKLIATATIGTDHIDKEYCASRGITVCNAPGCNAPAVAQYVFGTLMQIINRPLAQHTIGVVGVGHVGEIVARWAEALEMRVLRCDPPRQAAGDPGEWVDLDTIAREADIVTFHTPLTRNGEHPTYHIAGEEFFSKCRRAPIIINSARGSIVDTQALINAKQNGLVGKLIIDCWEGEPTINRDLLALTSIATPHIAGYSKEGKIRASQAAIDAFTSFFNLPKTALEVAMPAPAAKAVSIKSILNSYDPTPESIAVKTSPEDFEKIRNNYTLRHEASEDLNIY